MEIIFYYDVPGSIVAHSTKAPVFAVKSFERGYYPIYTRSNAAKLNDDKLTPEVLESALIASVAGWDCPGAKEARAYVEAMERAAGIAEDRRVA